MSILVNSQIFVFLFCLFYVATGWSQSLRFQTDRGKVFFQSDAPLELIEAASDNLQGILDLTNQTFAFVVKINSFEGFNSPLQQEHFNENYLESRKFPNSTFTGKIIEKNNFLKEGKYTIRAKGKLTIHGVSQERIIKSTLEYKNGKFFIQSFFTVLLEEHDIDIPKVVHQKIAEEIKVSIKATLESR